MTDWIICGWYTPDYRPWWDRLRANLDAIGAPHDFVERPKSDGGWEANTHNKPAEIIAAMDRHPGKTIIFTDVDCTVPGGLSGIDELTKIAGDIALYQRAKWRKTGIVGGGPRTGTLVLRPTPSSRAFVETWCRASREAPRFTVDQDSVKLAIGSVPNLTVTYLDVRFCAVPADKCAAPIVLHDRASKKRKFRSLIRMIGRLTWKGPHVVDPITAQESPTTPLTQSG